MFGIEEEIPNGEYGNLKIICYVEGELKDAIFDAVCFKEYRESDLKTFQKIKINKIEKGKGIEIYNKWNNL